MMQRQLVEFRTPQHPSLGTNNWGGASPLLARNVPKESLDLRYLRLNTIRTRDEIFPATNEDFINLIMPPPPAVKYDHTSTPRGVYGLFSKLAGLRKQAVLGSSNKRSRWLPKWDPRNRWPQGWG